MATLIHLDTHVVAWLYAGRHDLLGRKAVARIEQSDLLVSPMVLLELEYLRESGRTSRGAEAVIDDLASRIGLRVSETPFSRVVDRGLTLTWTRDPFDRLIVAHAAVDGLPLVTKDRTIRANYRACVWD
ncbi:MAG: PIN domain-containing protein [Deltaproteobacteria bacterium]|nr:PIN domain-containing protein [Deltaproteobacteria bacterium]